jgi:hypothetical protein
MYNILYILFDDAGVRSASRERGNIRVRQRPHFGNKNDESMHLTGDLLPPIHHIMEYTITSSAKRFPTYRCFDKRDCKMHEVFGIT